MINYARIDWHEHETACRLRNDERVVVVVMGGVNYVLAPAQAEEMARAILSSIRDAENETVFITLKRDCGASGTQRMPAEKAEVLAREMILEVRKLKGELN